MKEIIAYEMVFDKALEYQNGIICVPFQEKYWDEYMKRNELDDLIVEKSF